MPKEITHWAIATMAGSQIQEPYLKSFIAKNMAPYLIGAIAFDIPYYASGRHSRHFTDIAAELHGVHTCRVWQLIAKLIETYPGKEDARIADFLLALMLGCITHVVVDSRFHPYIYYFTGNYYDRYPRQRDHSVFRHRQFEAHLDLYLQNILDYSGPTCVKTVVKQIPNKLLIEVLSQFYFGANQKTENEMTKGCMRNYSVIQSVFHNKLIKYALDFVGLLNTGARNCSALFYPRKVGAEYKALFENNRQYCHPVTGEVVRKSLEDIYKQCIEEILGFFAVITCDKTSGKIAQGILQFPAVSLETGYTCANPLLMRHFSRNFIQDN